MSYKPKYCCECGEKVERIDWKFWHSRRFCELCETDFKVQDALPYLKGLAIPLILVVVGFAFQKPTKNLNVSPNQLLSAANLNRNVTANQNSAAANANIVQTAILANSAPSGNLPTVVKAAEVKMKPPENSAAEAVEKVYFCGAATKKGTACSRRVRGGGRCWQHAGQTAMLAQEKLLASQ